jgi:hypothetical protein
LKVLSTNVTYGSASVTTTLVGLKIYTATANTDFSTDNSNNTSNAYTFNGFAAGTNTLTLLNSGFASGTATLTLTGSTNANGTYATTGTITTFTNITTTLTGTADSTALAFTIKPTGSAAISVGNPGQYGTTSIVGFTNFQLSGSATTLSLNVNNGVLLVQSNVTTYNGTVVSGFTTFSAVGAIATKFETDNSNTTPYTFNGSATGTNTLQLDKSTFGLNGATLTMNSGGGGTYVHGAVTSTTFTTMNIIGGTDVTDSAAALAKKVTAHADGSSVVIAAGAVTYSAGGFSSTLSGFTTYVATIATSFETDNSIAGITFT